MYEILQEGNLEICVSNTWLRIFPVDELNFQW